MMSGAKISILPELRSGRGTARRSRVVEGQAHLCGTHKVRHRRVEVAKDIVRSDPKRSNSMFGEQCISPPISGCSFFEIMCRTIDFDAKSRFGAIEIQDKGTGRMLATKLQSIWASAELGPEGDFGKSQAAAQLARSSDCFSRLAQHCVCPSTVLRTVPLPKTSLGRI